MTTMFKGEPNLTVNFNPPIGLLKHVQFDENGEFTTDNERVIARFHHHFDSVPVKTESFSCKKCDFTTDNKGLLMSHYRSEHPKEEDHE